MNEFLKWFKSTGLRKYGLAILIAIPCDIMFAISSPSMWTDGGTGASTEHLIMVTIAHLTIIGFNIALGKHMFDKFKADKNK